MLEGIVQSLPFHAQESALIVGFCIMTPNCVPIRMIGQDLGVILDQQANQGLHQLIVHHRNRNDNQYGLIAI